MSGNDQAFPSLTGLRHTSPSHQQAETVGGLTKREVFAALALQGMLSNATISVTDQSIPAENVVAKAALAFSDALLAELENPHA